MPLAAPCAESQGRHQILKVCSASDREDYDCCFFNLLTMHRYWDDMDGSMGMNPMSQFITRPRVSIPDDARKEQAKTWDFIWDDAGACWRCWRCLVTVQQFKNLKRHFGGVKCRQRSRTLACQSSRQMLRAGGFKTEPEDAPSRPIEFKSRMAAPAVESADAMDSQRALSDQGYSMTHVYQPSMPFVRQDGQEYEANKAHKASPQHEQQSARLSRLQTSVADILSASSYNLVTSARHNESENVVMPMTDSGEVDRLAVLCHCAYASQFSEDPEDIFKFACIDAKVNQCEEPPRGSCTPETQGPFPQAMPVPPLRTNSSSQHASTILYEDSVLPLNCGSAFTKAISIGKSCKLEKLGDWRMNLNPCDAIQSSRAASWF